MDLNSLLKKLRYMKLGVEVRYNYYHDSKVASTLYYYRHNYINVDLKGVYVNSNEKKGGE